MVRLDWVLIGCLSVLAVQLGLANGQEETPDNAIIRNGNCSYAAVFCTLGTSGCRTYGSDQYYCRCDDPTEGDGYINGTGCGDVVIDFPCFDENDCGPNAICDNGSCTCPPGYTGNGNECQNIDECEADPCPVGAVCQDNPGSYACSCKPSFELVDDKCVYKCRVNTECHRNGECLGGECTCSSGYAGDGRDECENVDECELNEDDCDDNANCVDNEGSYDCECKNGFDGSGRLCTELPRNCDEIYQDDPSADSNDYTVDTDGPGPLSAITVSCEMRDGMGITIIYPDDPKARKVPPRGMDETIAYPNTPQEIQPIIDDSDFCSQEFWLRCNKRVKLQGSVTWEDGTGTTHTSWATTEEGMCPCGVLGVCDTPESPCNCDGQNQQQEFDTGYIVDKTLLPVTKVSINRGGMNWLVGPLRCGPKPIDILRNCDEYRQKVGVKLNGPQIIDVDGPDGLLDPVLVYCDMQTYQNTGVTVIQNMPPEVVFTESGTLPIEYSVPGPVIEGLISGSLFCDQSFNYECQGGAQDFSVATGRNNRTLTYVPGGIPNIPGSCGCGVTQTCDDPAEKCNCAIDDGQTRRDLGVEIDKSNLPIVSVTAEFEGQKQGVAVLGPLRCSSKQFGIVSTCETYRTLGATDSYTYLIDPDGVGSSAGNVDPFHVQCIMETNPPQGITILNNEIVDTVALGRGNAKLEVYYPYVTPEQALALREKCIYATQNLKLSSDKFNIKPASNNRFPRYRWGYWMPYGRSWRSYYWYGNGDDEVDQYQFELSEDSGQIMVDQGDFTDKKVLPVGSFNLEKPALVDNDGSVEVELGPYKCFQLLSSCAKLFTLSQNRAKFGESMPEDGVFTIDPDGSGGNEPFEVECDFPKTTIPVAPAGDGITTSPDDGPVEECFDISYLDPNGNPLSPDKVTGLVQNSPGLCSQTLSLTCTNAPITDLISFETCDGQKQTGWAGSGGQEDTCACGLTGTCEQGVDGKCNCDIEDGTERSDAGRIVDSGRLPICKVCIKLNGTISDPSNPNPSRSAAFKVSDLVCGLSPQGVSKSCEKARIGSSVQESGTIFIDSPDGPIPVYCSYQAFPPAGILQLFPEDPEIPLPPDEEVDVPIEYKVFNLTMLEPLINDFDYCTQSIRLSCEDANLQVVGEYGWYSRDGVVQSYWNNPEGDGPCIENNGQCNCNLPGSMEDGGLIIDKELLPITRVRLAPSSGARTLFVGPVECYDIKRDCYDIMQSGDLSTVYSWNDTYTIDPDGPGPVEPFIVKCIFDIKNDNAITVGIIEESFPISVSGTDSVPFDIPFTYTGATPEQLNALAQQSEFCMQGVLYKCQESPVAALTLVDGSTANGFGLADDIETIGCACGNLGTCNADTVCRCDNMGPMGDFDQGYFTNKDQLPIVSATLGIDQPPTGSGRLTITELQCSKKPSGLPESCQDAVEKDLIEFPQEVLIYPTDTLPPFIVFCDIINGLGVARVKPADDPDKPITPGNTDVPYEGLTDEQLIAVVTVSEYCYQPVLIDCFATGFIGDGFFAWRGPDGQIHRYWGNGDPATETCTCGAEGLCGGDGGRDEMSQRKCNCDIGDNIWRRDGGVMRIKEDLPIRSFNFMPNGLSGEAQANITVGDLICGSKPIDLPVCEMEYDDCGENSVCVEKSISNFDCGCLDGFQGRINGQGINDVWANGRECIDNDECSFLACPFSADCTNMPGTFNCTCNEGYNQIDATTCEEINECELDLDDCHDDAKCYNLEGGFECKCKRGFVGNGSYCEPEGECACFGDPHCLSFDQKWLHFMGLCEYTMARDNCGGEPNFEVIIKDWSRDLDIDNAAWVKSVLIRFRGLSGNIQTIEFRQNREIRVNRVRRTGYSGDGIRVFDNGRKVLLLTYTGLRVTWDGVDSVLVSLGKRYINNVCGICGNYNDNPGDDWEVGPRCLPQPNPLTTNSDLFANSWVTSASGGDVDPRCDIDCDPSPVNNPQCKMNPNAASFMCSTILDPAFSIFSASIPRIDPGIMAGLYVTCNMDMCRSPNSNMDNLCNIAERLAEESANIGERVPSWRNVPPLQCGDPTGDGCGVNMVESSCGGAVNSYPGPVQTCEGLMTGADPFVEATCVSGCFCQENYYLEGTSCVPEEDCGCVYMDDLGDQIYMLPGQTDVLDGCGTSIKCVRNNVTETDNVVCDENATCDIDDDTGDFGCLCNVGFIGDGETCSVDPCANVNCGGNEECVEGECRCLMGFTSDCEQCVDIDECTAAEHNCTTLGNKCINIPGSFVCECEEGFFNIEGECTDINECQFGVDDCPENSECRNTPGGWECVCCAGFNENANAVCVPDGSGLKDVNSGLCCSCLGPECEKQGQVCGSDGNTYPSLKRLKIERCKQQAYIELSYEGPCMNNCDDAGCEAPKTCSVEGGKAICKCPDCVESEANFTIESVCSDTHIRFKSMCDFEKYTCGLPNSEIEITSTGKECDESGAGLPMNPWDEWGPCSECGEGFQTRTRTPIDGIKDSQGNPITETAIALCYTPCPEGPCVNNSCTDAQKCVPTDEETYSCKCPDCNNRGDEPVCGRVGNIVKTYENLCELDKDACQSNLPMTLVSEVACEVKPSQCTKTALWETRTFGGCASVMFDWGKCEGGCGSDPKVCCTEIIEMRNVTLLCSSLQIERPKEVVVGCNCEEEDAEEDQGAIVV